MPEKWVLRQYQSLPLRAKIGMSMNRIIEWHDHFNGDVCVSFSGGKDSTVLAHLVHDFYPDVPLVFANTGLEYPEIQSFARKMGAVFVRPKMSFSEVISKYGYPIISKENAEAIYYARRIRNKVEPGIISVGGVLPQPNRNVEKSTVPEYSVMERPHGTTEWRRANLTNSLPDTRKQTEVCWVGYDKVIEPTFTGKELYLNSKETIRRRGDLQQVRQEEKHEQTGTSGEEKQSPG